MRPASHMPQAEMMTLGVGSMFSSLDSSHGLRHVQVGEVEHVGAVLAPAPWPPRPDSPGGRR